MSDRKSPSPLRAHMDCYSGEWTSCVLHEDDCPMAPKKPPYRTLGPTTDEKIAAARAEKVQPPYESERVQSAEGHLRWALHSAEVDYDDDGAQAILREAVRDYLDLMTQSDPSGAKP